jgi:hypothetical protein
MPPLIEHKIIDGIEYKWCFQNKHWMKILDFGKNIRMSDGLSSMCKSCSIDSRKKNYQKFKKDYQEKSKERYNLFYKNNMAYDDKKRNTRFKKLYGINLEEYNKMLSEQNNLCYICHKTNNDGRKLSIDHNHETGKIRKLLCKKCNSAIGLLNEDIELFKKCIEYLGED